jgi:cob(I)alamin adenosyltransferase
MIVERMIKKGYVQVYTGNGKGKTTAALGLVLRAAGAGFRIFILQFIKKGQYSELKALEKFSNQITLEQYGLGRLITRQPAAEDFEIAQKGLQRLKEVVTAGAHDLVVVEEGNIAVAKGLISVSDLIDIIDGKPTAMELVITGRNAAPEIIERADLVTEMKEVKHYFNDGVGARVGIEK